MPDPDILDKVLRRAYGETLQPGIITADRAPVPIPQAASPQQVNQFLFPQRYPNLQIPQSDTEQFYTDFESNSNKYSGLKMYKMLPGMQDVMRERGVPENLIQQMQRNGIPETLAAELPVPQERGFMQKLMDFAPARYVAQGISYAMMPFSWANTYIDKPWAGLLKYVGESFTSGEQTVERNVKQFGLYTGLRKGWEDTEANKWLKMGVELSNPLWWIPGSAWLKGLSAGSKLALGAETTKHIADALSGASKTITAPVTSAMMKVPFVRMTLEESPQSLLRNVNGRSEQLLDNLESLYVQSGRRTVDMFDDLIRGEVRHGLQESISNPYQIRIMDEYIKKSITNRAGESVDIANILDLPTLRDIAATGNPAEVQLAKETLSAQMRRAYSSVYNVRLARGEGMFYDAYAFWRAAVLATPTNIAQNFVENTVRSLIYNHSSLPLGNVQTIARTARDLDIRNVGLSLMQRLRGGNDVGQYRGILLAEQQKLSSLLDAQKTLGAPTASIESKVAAITQELSELPATTEFLHLTNAMPIEQIMRNANQPVNQYEKTLMGIFNKTFGNWFNAQNQPTIAAAVRFPHAMVNYLDSALLVRTYGMSNAQYIRAMSKFAPSLADKSQSIDDWLHQNPEFEREFGTDFMQQVREYAVNSPNQEALAKNFQLLSEHPFPEISRRIDNSSLPSFVTDHLHNELWRASITSNPSLAADTVNLAKSNLISRQKQVADIVSNDLEAANKVFIQTLPDHLHDTMQRIMDMFDLDKRAERAAKEIENTFNQFKDVSQETAHEQALLFAHRQQLIDSQRIVKQSFVAQVAKEAMQIADPVESKRYLESVIPRIQEAIAFHDKHYEQIHPYFAGLTFNLANKHSDAEIKAGMANYLDSVDSINPKLVANLRKLAPTRENLWNNYYTSSMQHFDDLPKLITRILGMPDSSLPEIRTKQLIETWLREIDDIGNVSTKLISEPSLLLGREAAFKSMFTQLDNLYSQRIETVKEAEQLLNKASDFAANRAYMLMGNYAKTRGFDEVLRGVFPFFYFPSRSIPFYLRTGIEYPAVPRILWGYQTNTEEPGSPASLLGYYRIPGIPGAYINPLRYMMGMQILGSEPLTGLGQPVAESAMTALSMMGFSLRPDIPLSMELASRIVEATSNQQYSLTRGEPRPLLPQLDWARKGFMAATGKFIPEPTQLLMGLDTQPAWFKRQIEKSIAAQGHDPAAVLSLNANAEQRQTLVNAYRDVAAKGLISVAAPVKFRFPEEIKTIADQSQLLESFGISKDQQMQIRETGINPMQYFNNLTRRQLMDSHPDWRPWLGITSPFLSKEESAYWEQTRSFWQAITDSRNRYDAEQTYYTNRVSAGLISPAEWRARYSEIQEHKSADYEALSDFLPLALINNQRREDYMGKFGRPLPPLHVEDRAVAGYYAIKAPLDERTGRADFVALQSLQDSYLNSLPDDIREYVIADTTRPRNNADFMEVAWRQERRKLREWDAVKTQLFEAHPDWKELVDKLSYFRSADPMAYTKALKSPVYKKYSRALELAHEELLRNDAELEALLHKWGIISGPIVNSETKSWLAR